VSSEDAGGTSQSGRRKRRPPLSVTFSDGSVTDGRVFYGFDSYFIEASARNGARSSSEPDEEGQTGLLMPTASPF